MTDTLIFKISPLLDKGTGASETYSFEGPVKFEGIKTKSDIKGTLEIMRIEEGVNTVVSNAEIIVEFKCEKCLKTLKKKIEINFFEKQYFFEAPRKPEDPNDTFLIDMKNQKIDLSEPLRQEIILHFPANQVCSLHCKGICPICGKDLNKEDCKCEKVIKEENKPLSSLKKLLK